ncbi:hypothetical protein Lser_V15G05191 [Lactuca serriola]
MASFKSSPSSSSSLPTLRWTHDAFLSFRGEDTRNNFIDHLYAALDQRGLHVFKDDKALHKGKAISQDLLEAIKESRFAVVVFSKNYAGSSWCLDELVKIMECKDQMGLMVLPVFYHIDPSDVRQQKRDFDTAFQQHDDKFKREMDQVNRWRKALAAAASLSGWHVKETGSGGESSVITEIVEEILYGTKSHGMEKKLIGIESHINELYSLLGMEMTEEVHFVGILGMGGIGKTIIAKALFRRIAHNFECSSFVRDVRENSSSKRDICALQERVLSEILNTSQRFFVNDPEDGAYMIHQRFCKNKVLLVLDDVDDVEQLKFLSASQRHWFGPGSRIIITTRDEHLLSGANAKYKPDFLHMNEAIELFCLHAFRKNSPPKGYEELSYRAINYASGLPLALEVLGAFFHGREVCVWESALDKLAEISDDKILDILKLSYDGLDVYEKKVFLDIACFFKGKDKEHVSRVLDSFGFHAKIGIKVLEEKSLITISNKRLDMHDLIQAMGWQIVRERFMDSRLWQLEQIHDLAKGKKNPEAIEAIMLMDNEYLIEDYDTKLGLSADVFERMKNLRLLDIDGKFTSTQPTFLPDELRWLHWNDYPFLFLPLGDMCKLVGLKMEHGSDIKHLWEGRKILPNLKFIHLESLCKLTSFPDVSGAPNIKRLIFSKCWGLEEVHESLGSHRGLVYLDMNGCSRVKHLPSRLEMESLETLILSGCESLERFPEVSPCMTKLSQINLYSCSRIKELPSSIRYLSSLNLLNLTNCWKLKSIPDSICELKDLKCLHLHNCKELNFFPKRLGSMKILEELLLGFTCDTGSPQKSVGFKFFTGLSSLKKLDLSWRRIHEKSFPKNLDAFSSLEELYLSGNHKLVELPASICHLSRLRRLELNNCSQLESLCALPSSIQVLKANDCISLKKIGDVLKDSEWLYKIWLTNCHKLLEDEENQRYLDKMLQLSFIKSCAAVNHRLSISIPGSKIPSWFKEKKDGCRIGLKLPHKWHTKIMGFLVGGVFSKWGWGYVWPRITFKLVNDGNIILKSEVNHIKAIETTENGGNVWISYMPLGFFQKMYHDLQPQDWSHIQGNLKMTISLTDGTQSVAIGAHVIYKENVQQLKTSFSDYGNMVHVDDEDLGYDELISGNTYVYEDKFDEEALMPLRSRTSARCNKRNLHCVITLSGPR